MARREGRGVSSLNFGPTRSVPVQGGGGGSKDASRKPPRMHRIQKQQEAPGRLGSSQNDNVSRNGNPGCP